MDGSSFVDAKTGHWKVSIFDERCSATAGGLSMGADKATGNPMIQNS